MNKINNHRSTHGFIHGTCFLLTMLCLTSLFITTTGRSIGNKRSLLARQNLRATARRGLCSLLTTSKQPKTSRITNGDITTVFSRHQSNKGETVFLESSNRHSTVKAVMVTKDDITELFFTFHHNDKVPPRLTSSEKHLLRESLQNRARTAQKNFSNLSEISPDMVRNMMKTSRSRKASGTNLSFVISEKEKEKAVAQALLNLRILQNSEDSRNQDRPEQEHHQQSS